MSYLSKIVVDIGRILSSCKAKALEHKPEGSHAAPQILKRRERKYSETVTRAPGSIDSEPHKSEKNRGTNNLLLHFPLVLPIVNTGTKQEELTSHYFCLAKFNRLFCHESLRGVPALFFIGCQLDHVDNCCNKVWNLCKSVFGD